jgi:Predicted extracellular nuclease
MRTQLTFSAFALIFLKTSLAVTISEINGDKFLSSYKGKSVSDVKGLVTAKGPSGFWIRSTSPDSDNRTSESVYIYGTSAVSKVDVGTSSLSMAKSQSIDLHPRICT